MLHSDELEGIPIKLSAAVSSTEDRIMADLVERIRASMEISATADWQLNRLRMLGESDEYIRETLQDLLGFSDKEMARLYSDTLGQAYIRDKALYDASGVKLIPFKENKELQTIIGAVKKQTSGTFRNITNTMGFAKRVNGKIVFTELSKYYQEALDGAMMDLTTGTYDYNSILKRIVGEMTSSGLRTVDYASGRSFRVESAMRMALMTGFNQTVAKINDDVAEQLDTDYFEVDWHGGARPSHQKWQGKVYSKKQLTTICGLGSAGGLLGINCYHSYNPFVPGASVRNYTDKQLKQMNADENTPTPYKGQEYTTYEATQRQRQLEALMRKQRQEIKLLEKGGADKDEMSIYRASYRGTSAQYNEFSEAMGIPQQRKRVTVDGLSKV
ncbi:phage minor capsid protein [Parasporobacterium paucivorans]|uniref:Phage minor capsid protein 2 n=1 Tax=Parasporobacterium paucivorans DSM 15970 TaxID=1122934 RepID=A0A1M6B2V3_9FIRM|nr:phage minor capsid protein [Parasporobacterium paucivorans]SHI43010.1 Phage minor capsid protein 2 [Parasporobacterium paucivorans DSM 15970]